MNIIDSSGWLEYFADGPNARIFSRPLQNAAELIVPAITIYEVFKTVLRQRNESDALQAVALMLQGSVVDLTAGISISALADYRIVNPAGYTSNESMLIELTSCKLPLFESVRTIAAAVAIFMG